MEKYSSYKDSGVEWIGEIPYNWGLKNLKLSFNIEKGKLPKGLTDVNIGNLLPYLSMEVLRGGSPKEYSPLEDGVFIEKDEIGIVWDGSNSGEIIKINQNGILSSTVSKLSSNDKNIEDNYSFYLLKYYETDFRLNTIGMGIPHMDGNRLRYTKILIPPLPEQQQIVSFLDTKTTLIDTLIEKTQRKIELLKEQRTSLINHIVTKGINPNVEMKDSGVEWIGEIPEHWCFIPLKNICYMKGRIGWKGLKQEEFLDDGKYLLITGQDIKNDIIDWSKCYHISKERYDESPEIMLKKQDLLFTKDGTIGKTLLIESLPKPTSLNSHLLVIRPLSDKYISKFLQYNFKTTQFLVYVEHQKTGTTFYGVSQDTMMNYKGVFPPLSEQQQIVEYLDKKTNLIDTTISREQKRIELLKEYRQSLISNVITGKIKVSNYE